jgi:hypothetical protein
VHVFLAAELEDCVAAHRHWSSLPHMRAASAHEPSAPLRLLAPAHMIRAILPAARWLEASLRRDTGTIRAFASRFPAAAIIFSDGGASGALDDDCSGGSAAAAATAMVPAWRATAALPPLAERAAHTLLQVLNIFAATLADTQASLAADVVPSAADRAYVADITRSLDAIAVFVQRAQGALAQLRLGSATAYLDASAAVCDKAASLVHTMAHVAAARVAWTAAQRAALTGAAETAAAAQQQPSSSSEPSACGADPLAPHWLPPAMQQGAPLRDDVALAAAAPASAMPKHLENFFSYFFAAKLVPPEEPALMAALEPFTAAARTGGGGGGAFSGGGSSDGSWGGGSGLLRSGSCSDW